MFITKFSFKNLLYDVSIQFGLYIWIRSRLCQKIINDCVSSVLPLQSNVLLKCVLCFGCACSCPYSCSCLCLSVSFLSVSPWVSVLDILNNRSIYLFVSFVFFLFYFLFILLRDTQSAEMNSQFKPYVKLSRIQADCFICASNVASLTKKLFFASSKKILSQRLACAC